MQRTGSLFSNTLLLGAANAVSKLLSFLLMPLFTAWLTPADFGTADIVVSTALLLLPFVSLNAPEAVFRFLAGREGEEADRVLTVGVLFLLLGFLLLLLLFPLSFYFPVLKAYQWYLFFYVIASVARSYLAHLLRAAGRYRAVALQQIFCALVTLFSQIIWLRVFRAGVGGYLLGVILGDGLTAVLVLLLFLPQWKGRRFQFDRSLFSLMLRYALPLMPTAVLWWVTSASDRYVLLYYHGEAATGLYAAAAKIPALLTFAISVFMEAWHYTAVCAKEEKQTLLFGHIYKMLLPFALGATALLLVAAPPLIRLLYAAEYQAAIEILPYLALAALFSGLSNFVGSVYAVKLRSLASLLTALLGALLNVVLNFLLIPRFGGIGAAFATFVAYLAVFLVRLVHATRSLAFPHYLGKLALSLALLLSTASAVMRANVLTAALFAGFSLLPFAKEIGMGAIFLQKRARIWYTDRQKNTKSTN